MIAVGMFILRIPLTKERLQIVMISTLMLGPGTIGCVVLARFRWQRLHRLLPFAFAVNMLTSLLLIIGLALFIEKQRQSHDGSDKTNRIPHSRFERY